jgi:hypothetical protein
MTALVPQDLPLIVHVFALLAAPSSVILTLSDKQGILLLLMLVPYQGVTSNQLLLLLHAQLHRTAVG